jgi:hypothetical protein
MDHDIIKLTDVQAFPDYSLVLTFETGERKRFDFRPELEERPFGPLHDIALFLQARNDDYGVVWTDDIDIASEHLYYNGTPLTDLKQ